MIIQYKAGPERKRLAAAATEILGTKSTYAGMPTAAFILGSYSLSRGWTLTGPDDRSLVAQLAQQGFEPMEETYDAEPAEPEDKPEADPSAAQDRLTIEVPFGDDFTPAKMANLEKLVASRDTLLKKVLGTDALPIERTKNSLLFSWFPVDDNAMIYGQLACALVRAAMEATRITAKERPCESERFHMCTYLLKLGFIGPDYRQARKILLRGLSGSGSYAKAQALNSADADEEE